MKLRVRVRVCSKTASFLISLLYVVFLFPICSFTSFVVLTLRTLTAKIYQSACQKLRRWSLKRGSIICGSWGGVTASTVTRYMNSSTFSFYISFSTTVVTGRTVHRWMYPVTVFPTIGRKARPALVFTMKNDLNILKCIMSGTILSNKTKKSNKEMSTSLSTKFLGHWTGHLITNVRDKCVMVDESGNI